MQLPERSQTRRWGAFICLLANASFTTARLLARAQLAVSLPTDAPSPVQAAGKASTTAFEEPLRAQLQKRAVVKEIEGYTHLGCWQDGSNKILTVTWNFDNAMNPELCRNVCSLAKCNMFGLEQSYHCYCGNSIEPFAVSATDDSCTKTCSGATDVICGGQQRINLYSATANFPAGKQFGVDGFSTSATSGPTSTKRNSGSSSTPQADPDTGSEDSSSGSNSGSSKSSSTSSQKGLSTGTWVGIVIGVAVAVCAATAVAAYFVCGRRPRASGHTVSAPIITAYDKPPTTLAPQALRYHQQPSPAPTYATYAPPIGTQELPNSGVHEMAGTRH